MYTVGTEVTHTGVGCYGRKGKELPLSSSDIANVGQQLVMKVVWKIKHLFHQNDTEFLNVISHILYKLLLRHLSEIF